MLDGVLKSECCDLDILIDLQSGRSILGFRDTYNVSRRICPHEFTLRNGSSQMKTTRCSQTNTDGTLSRLRLHVAGSRNFKRIFRFTTGGVSSIPTTPDCGLIRLRRPKSNFPGRSDHPEIHHLGRSCQVVRHTHCHRAQFPCYYRTFSSIVPVSVCSSSLPHLVDGDISGEKALD